MPTKSNFCENLMKRAIQTNQKTLAVTSNVLILYNKHRDAHTP